MNEQPTFDPALERADVIRREPETPVTPVESEARCPNPLCRNGRIEQGPHVRIVDDCPTCRGTGQERVIPVTDLLATLRKKVAWEWDSLPPPHDRTEVGKAAARMLEKVEAWLDEYPAIVADSLRAAVAALDPIALVERAAIAIADAYGEPVEQWHIEKAPGVLAAIGLIPVPAPQSPTRPEEPR